jgi:hypothetical protein
MASVRCIDVQARPTEFLDFTSLREHGEPGDCTASGISLPTMAGFTRMAGLLRV